MQRDGFVFLVRAASDLQLLGLMAPILLTTLVAPLILGWGVVRECKLVGEHVNG